MPRPAIQERLQRIGYEVSDPTARRRLLAALESEGVRAVPIQLEPLANGLRQLPLGLVGLVHDLAPWTPAATARLRDLRKRAPALPILLYPPVRPGIGQLLVDAAHLCMVSAQLMLDGPAEVGRLRESIRDLLDTLPRRKIIRRLALGAAGLSPESEAFCSLALGALESGDGGSATVKEIAGRLGSDRRTLERHARAARLPSPGELLDWMLLLYTAFASHDHEDQLAGVARSLGLDPRRLQRIRRRLRAGGLQPINQLGAFESVVNAFLLRCMELRHGALSRRPVARRSRRPVPIQVPSPTPPSVTGPRRRRGTGHWATAS